MSASSHNANHEERMLERIASAEQIADVLSGDLADCPECREFVADLVSAADHIETIGAECRTAVEEAAALDIVPGDHLVTAFGEKLLGNNGQKSTSTSRRGLLLTLGATAAAGLCAVLWNATRPADIPADVTLGPASLKLIQPLDAVESWGTFRWTGDLPPGGWYRLVIRADGAGSSDRTLVDVHPLTLPEWKPKEQATTDWDERVHWEVRVFDGSGAELDGVSGSAWQSPSSQ